MNDPLASAQATSGWIAGQVRRASRNSLIWNGVGLLAIALVAWFSGNYYYNFFYGPFPYDDAQILQAAEHSGNGGLLAYIQLTDRRLIETGFENVMSEDGKRRYSNPYSMTPVGDKMMIVMTERIVDAKHLVGPLSKLGTIESGLIADLENLHPELRGKFLPIYLNEAAAFKVIGYLGLLVGIPVLFLCLFNISRASWSLQHPASHRMMWQLAKFGDPIDVATGIDREMAAGPVAKYGKSLLTSLWLLRPTAFGMIAVPLSDIVWMYHLKQSESFAVLCLRTGKTIAMPLRGEQVDKLLREVSERVPWALDGYDVETLKMWRKKPADVAALSDQQRAKHLAGE